jgi:hypothetical protein
VGRCEGIRKPAYRHSATGTTLIRSTAIVRGPTSHHGRARSRRQSVDPSEPLRRRETAGCSIVRPTGGNSFKTDGFGRNRKIPFERGVTSSRANEARVLVIEAVDGRSRSYASRVRSRQRRKARQAKPNASSRPPWKEPPDAVHGQSPGELVCEASSCSIKNSRRSGPQAKAGGQSIRWKASGVEAAPSLYGGGVRAALAGGSSPMTSSKGGGVGASGEWATIRWMSRRSKDRRRKSGVLGNDTYDQLSTDGAVSRVPAGDKWTSKVGGFSGEGSPSGNNARRVSVANIARCASNGSSGSVTGARVRSMGSVATPIHGEARHASRTVVPKLARVTPAPILHDPHDANHAGSNAKDITANR